MRCPAIRLLLTERAVSKNSSGFHDALAASIMVFSPLVYTAVCQNSSARQSSLTAVSRTPDNDHRYSRSYHP